MSLSVSARAVHHPLKAPFRISRGVKTAAEVVVVEVRSGDHIGRGESVPYARYDETVAGVLAQLKPVLAVLQRDGEGNIDHGAALAVLAPGAARNALDCALWDLRAKLTGVSVAEATGLPVPASLVTAVTVSLDAPEAMAAAARAVADAPLIKIKLSAEDPAARLRAVAAAAPNARFIVDPNEGWTFEILHGLRALLADLPIALVEQPLPADADGALDGYDPPYVICADESVHVGGDLAALRSRYPYPETLSDALALNSFTAAVTVINRGYPGDTAQMGLDRWTAASATDVAILMYGTNDGKALAVPVDTFKKNMAKMIEREFTKNAVVILISPPLVNDVVSNTNIASYTIALHQLAQEYNVLIIDAKEQLGDSVETKAYIKGAAGPLLPGSATTVCGARRARRSAARAGATAGAGRAAVAVVPASAVRARGVRAPGVRATAVALTGSPEGVRRTGRHRGR